MRESYYNYIEWKILCVMRQAKQFLFSYKVAVHIYISLLVYCYKTNVSANNVDWLQEIWGTFLLL
jgi:hypothetical protein